jgi:hypothetical protein
MILVNIVSGNDEKPEKKKKLFLTAEEELKLILGWDKIMSRIRGEIYDASR